MGNTATKKTVKKEKSLSSVVDYIATNYILTQNFKDMEKLSDQEYCNNLVIMTSDIIGNKLNEIDIKYLAQRLKNGVEVNESVEEKVMFLKKKDIPELDVSNPTTKRRMCIGIAKFYVKVAHLFAAIVTTINPVYTFKNKVGANVNATILNKHDIPKGARTNIMKLNICSNRLNALINNQSFNVDKNAKVTIKPKFCNMNLDNVRGRDKNLNEEPGIPELEKLYYDKYDDDTGGFVGMSSNMRKIYEKDVKIFYSAFTGNTTIPLGSDGKPVVKKFKDIPLRDFHKSEGCMPGGVYTKSYSSTLKNKLFEKYARHIREMMAHTNENQNKLLEIVESIFVVTINPRSKRKETVIVPSLTYEKLQKLVEKARRIIIDLYVRCEDDFIKGLEIFEAIVSKQIMETSKEQISALENAIQTTIADPPSKSDPTDDDNDETANETKSQTPDLSESAREVVDDVIDAAADSVTESSKEANSPEQSVPVQAPGSVPAGAPEPAPTAAAASVAVPSASVPAAAPTSQSEQKIHDPSTETKSSDESQNKSPGVQMKSIQNIPPVSDSGGFYSNLGNTSGQPMPAYTMNSIDPMSFI